MLKQASHLIFIAFLVFGSTVKASDFPSLISKVPSGSNSLVLLDVEAILASPIAKANGWERRFNDGTADRPLYLPPEADKIAIAAQLDLVRGCSKSWEVAVMGMKEPISMSLIARAEGGYADEINGVKAAWVPSDAFFAEIDTNTLGLLAPADRQAVARWVQHARSAHASELSDYLKSLTMMTGKGAQVVMGIDATNAVQAHRVRSRLEESALIAGDLDSTVQLIRSMKGMILQLTFSSKVEANARIDFGVPVTLKPDVAKSLIMMSLENMELSLPGTEQWSCQVKGQVITLTGELDNDGLRRVFSLMELPTSKFSSLKEEDIDDHSAATMAKCSKAYFQSIDSLLTDLRKRTKSNTGGDSGWTERYASKIDRLPVLHVDEDLLTYGEKVTETLRIIAGSRKLSNMQGASAGRAARSEAGVSSNNDGYGYRAYNYTSPQAAVANAGNIRSDATASGTVVKLQGWTLIDNATLEIRKSMTQKYSVEF